MNPTTLILSSIFSAAIAAPASLPTPEDAAQHALRKAKAERLVRDLEWSEASATAWWKGSLLEQLRGSRVYIKCAPAEVSTTTKRKSKSKSTPKSAVPSATPLGCTPTPKENWHEIDGGTLEGLRELQQMKRVAAEAEAAKARAKAEEASKAAAKAKANAKKMEEDTQNGRLLVTAALGHRPRKRLRLTRRAPDGTLSQPVGYVEVKELDNVVFKGGEKPENIPMSQILKAEKKGYLDSEFWCSDVITACWNDRRVSLSGLRLLLEPTFAYVVPFQGEENFSFSTSNIGESVAVGLELNLIGGWLSYQTFFITPHASELTNQNGGEVATVRAKAGVGLGFSTLNGALALGYGYSFWDRTTLPAFAAQLSNRTAANSNFLYFALQPASLARTAFVGIRERIQNKQEAKKAEVKATTETETETETK